MLSQLHLNRYADVLLWGLRKARKDRFRKNDVILIRLDPPALPLAEVLYERIVARGMHPVLRMEPTAGMEKALFQFGDRSQLSHLPAGEEKFTGSLNGSIFLLAPQSLTHLSGVDPKKIGMVVSAKKRLRDIIAEREKSGLLGWTLCLFPTEALAAHAEMPPAAYARQVVQACFLNRTAPVEKWQEVFDKAREIKNRLNRLKALRYHVESDRMDLQVEAGQQRRWVGISGRNIPSFEIFTSPDWRGTNGVYFADQPCFRSGNLVHNVRLEFKAGQVVAVSAERGEDFVKAQIRMDAGANKIGEFSLTDRRFSRIDRFMANTLYDENYGGRFGNCHIALGSSYSNTYSGSPASFTRAMKRSLGFNDSALHWDLVNTEKKRVVALLAGGGKRVLYENGEFQV